MNITKTNPLFSKKLYLVLAVSLSFFAFSSAAFADEEFYGTIESRPTSNLGIWIISGQQIEVTDKTDLDADNGALIVGACVEVEHDKGVAEDIETMKAAKCSKK